MQWPTRAKKQRASVLRRSGQLGGSGGDSLCGLSCETADAWHDEEELMGQPLIKARDCVIGLSDERVRSQRGSEGEECLP